MSFTSPDTVHRTLPAYEEKSQMNYSTLLKADARNYWWNEDFTLLMAHRIGLSNIQTVLDVVYLHPPYESSDQKAQIAFIEKLIAENSFYCFPHGAAKQFFEAASEDRILFEEGMVISLKLNNLYKRAIEDKTLSGPFGGEMILVMGEKG